MPTQPLRPPPAGHFTFIARWSAHPLPCYLPSVDVAGVEDLSCSCPWWRPTSTPLLQLFFSHTVYAHHLPLKCFYFHIYHLWFFTNFIFFSFPLSISVCLVACCESLSLSLLLPQTPTHHTQTHRLFHIVWLKKKNNKKTPTPFQFRDRKEKNGETNQKKERGRKREQKRGERKRKTGSFLIAF